MNIKPELKSALEALGITDVELAMLQGRMMSLVTSLEADLASLDGQIATLQTLRAEVEAKLGAAYVTVAKLVDPDTQE